METSNTTEFLAWTEEDEGRYLHANPDVMAAVREGRLSSGLSHWSEFGRFEERPGVSTRMKFSRESASAIIRTNPPLWSCQELDVFLSPIRDCDIKVDIQGDDPSCNLQFSGGGAVSGWTFFFIKVRAISGNLIPRLYWSDDGAYGDENSFVFPKIEEGENLFFLRLPEQVQGLRIDWDGGASSFRIERFFVISVSRLVAFFYLREVEKHIAAGSRKPFATLVRSSFSTYSISTVMEEFAACIDGRQAEVGRAIRDAYNEWLTICGGENDRLLQMRALCSL